MAFGWADTVDVMRFSALASDLYDAMLTAEKATPVTPAIVAYSGVQIRVSGGAVTFVGSDGDTHISVTLPAGADPADGASLVVPRPVVQLLNKVERDTLVTFSRDEVGDLLVDTGSAAPYRFRELAATFPARPVDGTGLAEVDIDLLGAAVKAVRCSVGKDHATLCTPEDGTLHLTTTDKYRLTVASIPGAAFADEPVVVPLDALDQMAKHDMSRIGLDPTGKQLRATGSRVGVAARLADIAFPAVDGPVKAATLASVGIDGAGFLAALERLASVGLEKAVQVHLDDRTMTLTVDNIEVGFGQETVPLAGAVDAPFTCMLGRAYLVEALKSHDGAAVTMKYSGPLDPVKFVSDDGIAVLSLLMPVRA